MLRLVSCAAVAVLFLAPQSGRCAACPQQPVDRYGQIFIVGNDDGTQLATLRLRSGDAIVMSAASRYAWHAVPKIVPDTCPTWLRDWPDIPNGSQYSDWQGWMANKRINLNVRQMQD